MHLPDGIIPLNQAIIYWIISIIIISIVFYKFSKDENKEKTIVQIAIYAVFTTIISSYQYHHHWVYLYIFLQYHY
jgi:cobalt/nickel transport system permease protein